MILEKRDIIAAIEEMPDDADLGELLHSLYVRYEVAMSEKEFAATGRSLSQEEMRALAATWQKYGGLNAPPVRWPRFTPSWPSNRATPRAPLVADIFAAVDRLGDFPESGAAFEGLVGYRHWTVRRHRVIYRVEGDLVLIVAVVDGRRHFDPSSIA